jgi:hypothetical protein
MPGDRSAWRPRGEIAEGKWDERFWSTELQLRVFNHDLDRQSLILGTD